MTLWKSVNSQPFLDFLVPHPQLFNKQNYMVPLTFQKPISQLFQFKKKKIELFCWSFSWLRPYFMDSKPLCTNLTISQPIPAGWEWPKSNSQLFPKFSMVVRTPIKLMHANHMEQIARTRVPTHLKWGNSRVIKGSTIHFQGYFWKTVITLLYVNKISSKFSHLFQDCFWYIICSILSRYQ